MDPPSPRLAQLAFRLAIELSDLQHQTEKLMRHLHVNVEDCLVLQPPKKKSKTKDHKKKHYRLSIKETLETPIEYESLE